MPSRTITACDDVYTFAIDDYTANRLLEGLDDIAATLLHADEIAAYEAARAELQAEDTARQGRRLTPSAS